MTCKKERLFEIHISVNVKTKKIFAMKITDDTFVMAELPELVDDIKKSDRKTTVCKLFADGAYDGNDVFRYLSDNGIQTCIKKRKNARIKLKTNLFSERYVLEQRNGLQG
jgi:hypothetical protein